MVETERLILRQWQDCDFEPFAQMSADPKVMQYFPSCLSRQESDQLAAKIKERIEENGFGFWAIEVKKTGQFAGFTGLNVPGYELPFEPTFEIGWRLALEFWGQSIAYEAAKASLAFAFQNLNKEEIVSFTAAQNQPSRNLMERLGFTHNEETFAHPMLPADHALSQHVLYRLQKKDWIHHTK
ncbi:GNAT family N-acetyltransferase [Sneathiella limimaris]|uniref:GNAT family N-acetyltransferase n=1 Tax=Sneathiella limimaris TaxID=1964213 RepID=UPI00146F3F45|nr:GNAT family N-acetyltransferase [Sneathiella limimaris]